MSETVKLHISNLQRDIDSAAIEEEYTGSMDRRGKKIYLRYTTDVEGNATDPDQPAEDRGIVRNMIKLGPDSLEFIRSGAVSSRMSFKPGEKAVSSIGSDEVNMQTETRTREFRVTGNDGPCVEAVLVYDLFLNGQFVSQCSMNIRTTPV